MLTRAQLLDAGLSARGIEYRAEVGRLHRVHAGIYAVGHVPSSPLAHAMAAVLACGPGAVLSHRSAGVLWMIVRRWVGPVEVTAPGNHRHAGVWVHRSRTLTAREVTVHQGILVTTPVRTLLDLADVLDDRALTRALNEARVRRLLTLDDLAAQLERSPGRRATGRLRPFVDRADGPTRSTLEDDFLRFVQRYDLPRPEVNQVVAGYEVDALWRKQRLVVELDTRAYHGHEDAFERDRDKDANLLAAGYATVRVTGNRLDDTPAREAQRLRTLLATR